MKTLFKAILLLSTLTLGLVLAQDAPASPWTNSVKGGVNLTQTGFDNWSGGGENAFA